MLSARRKLKKDRDRFARLVGRFVLAFGDIENVTYFFLRDVPESTLYETGSTLPLGKRIDLVMELLSGNRKLTSARKNHFMKLLSNAKALSSRRNVLAHSPLVLSVYHHPKHGWTKSIMQIGSLKTREKVTLDQLRKQVRDSEKLAKLLYQDFGRISKALAKTT